MKQQVIDPDNLGSSHSEVSINILPPGAAKFGYVPDIRSCKPGDLILFQYRKPNILSRLIECSQRATGFSKKDSRWTHAAIFLDQDLILEAVPFIGVRWRTIYTDIPHRILRVRRNPDLSQTMQYKIALCAMRMLGARYSMRAAIAAGWQMQLGLWRVLAAPSIGPRIICSKVFYDAYAEMTLSRLEGCPIDHPITPAHLSATSSLVDVQVSWLKLNQD